MSAWEYEVVETWGVPLTSAAMNEYGNKGWELVTVMDAYTTLKGESEKATRYYVFKRPKNP
jgi:hypothetical protein